MRGTCWRWWSECRFQIAHSGEPVFLRTKSNHEGHYVEHESAYSFGGNAFLQHARSRQQRGPSTSFGWRLTALRMTNRMKGPKDDPQNEGTKDAKQSERPKTVEREQVKLALDFPPLLSSLYFPLFTFVSLLSSLYFPGLFSFPLFTLPGLSSSGHLPRKSC